MSVNLPSLPVNMLVPGHNIESYIQTVSSIPMLSAEKEKSLAERLYNEGDLGAARQLVLSHLRFVVHISKSYLGYGLPHADLIQEGNIGLMKAVKRFNPNFGVRLVSFAVHWIKAEIHEYVLRNWRVVKVATTKAQRKLFFNLRSAKKRLAWLTKDEVNAVAQDLGVKPATVREMEGRLSAIDMAFDGYDDDESGSHIPAHFIGDSSANPATQIEQSNWTTNANEQLLNALSQLDDRSRDIVSQRWLSDKKSTLHELAEKYQVSAERIRQLEQNAMKKLKTVIQTD